MEKLWKHFQDLMFNDPKQQMFMICFLLKLTEKLEIGKRFFSSLNLCFDLFCCC